MNEPVVLVENLFNRLAFPGHALVGDEEAAGYEAYHVATGRRSAANSWRRSTPNNAGRITVTCDRLRACNMLAIDRNANLRGAAISVTGSLDGMVTGRIVWSGTIPMSVTSPGDLDNANGVLTEEGAFLVRFPTDAYTSWRLDIPALGTGVVSIVGGLSLGMGLQLDYLKRPYGDNQQEVMRDLVTISSTGWSGGTTPVPRRSGTLAIQLNDEWSYELARLHLEGHFLGRNRTAWIVPNRNQAERALLAVRAPGVQGFTIETGWGYRQANIGYVEHEPRTNMASVV